MSKDKAILLDRLIAANPGWHVWNELVSLVESRSLVGECISRTFGGEWVEKDGWWGVQVSERIWACPFAKVEKQFENGPEDSVASFFTCIPVLDKHLAEERREAAEDSASA
jgi:hypothetical protein